MTREQIVILGLDEIQGIRWQCDICHTAISFRLTQTIQIPQGCPSCGAQLVDAKSFKEYEVVVKLVNAVKEIQDAGTQKTIKATVKLEISDRVV